MEFWNRHDTEDTTDFCPRQLTCYRLATGKLHGVMDFDKRANLGKLLTLLWTIVAMGKSQTCYALATEKLV